MNNYFSKNLYIQGLKKIRVSGTAFSLIIILLNAILPIIGITENRYYSIETRTLDVLGPESVAPFDLLIFLLVPLIVYDMFSFLNDRSKSDFWHAIPQKRTCVYISLTSAILTWAISTILISTLVNSLLWSLARWYELNVSTAIIGTLPYIVLAVLMTGVMLLAMTLTGTAVSNFLVGALFLLFFRVISIMFVTALESYSKVLYVDYGIFKFFGMEFFLPLSLLISAFGGDAEVYADWGLQIYTLVVGIVFLVLGCVSYNKRKSQSATKSAPSKLLQHIYRFAITLPFMLLIGVMMIIDGIDSYQLILVILAILVYVLYELVTTKRIRSVVRSLPYIAIPALCAVAICSSILIVGNSIDRMDIDADDVRSYAFTGNSYTYEDFTTKGVFVSNAEASEIIARSYRDSGSGDVYSYINQQNRKESCFKQRILIKLDSGRVIARRIYLWESDYYRLKNILETDLGYYEAYLKLPSADEITEIYIVDDYKISNNKVKELYDCMKEEYQTLSYSDKLAVKDSRLNNGSLPYINVSGYYGQNRFVSGYNIDFLRLPKTAEKYFSIITEGTNASILRDSITHTVKNIEEYEEKIADSTERSFYCTVNLIKMARKFDDGSYKIYGRDQSSNSPEVVKEILKIVLESENAFDYSDMGDLYRIELTLDSSLMVPFDEYELKYGEEGVMEIQEYIYESQKFYVNLDKESVDKIIDLLSKFSTYNRVY